MSRLGEWARSGGLVGDLVPTTALDEATRDAMFVLMDTNFIRHPRSVFEEDLAGKEWVVLMRSEEDGSLKGFSTFVTSQEHIDGQPMGVLFSGDTIVSPDAWGSMVLARVWLHGAWQAAARLEGPLYWFLICSGFRTYRFLSVFWSEYYPHPRTETPAEAQQLLDVLARRRFGDRYDHGIIRLPGGALREGIGTINDGRRRNAHVAFFESKNPGHARGDELACLCRLAPDNLSRAGWRIHRAITGG